VRFDTSGNTAWPLTLSSLHAGEIDFASQAGNFRFEFRGKKTLDQIDGTVDFADRHLPFAIRRLPSLPKPQNRVEAWQQDIAALSSRFIHYDRSFSPKERDAFLRFEIDCDALFVSIDAKKIGALSASKWRAPTARIVADTRLFDFDNFGAQVAEKHGAVGTG